MRLNQIIENFYQVEKVRTGKLFFRYISLKNQERERDGVVAYSYIRWLDDLVDSGINPDMASSTLDYEEGIMKGIAHGKKFETESYPLLVQLYQKYGDRIFDLFQKFIEAFRADNQIIMTGKPLDEQSLTQRTLGHTLPCFQVVSLIAFGRELEFNEEFKKLMLTWSNYDSLIDIREDLSAGLILFSQEELYRHGIHIHQGSPLPSSFRNMYNSLKTRTIRDLVTYSSSVERTNIPVIERLALHGYFLSRPIKLATSQYPLTEPEFIVKPAPL